MNIIDFLGRGWKYPVSIENGKIAISEDEDSVRESIMIILGTAKGERVMRPDFGCGINQLAFSINNSQTAGLISINIKEALLKWEPRIDVLDVHAYPDKDEENKDEGTKLNIYIEYMIKTTNAKNNLVYPFYLSR